MLECELRMRLLRPSITLILGGLFISLSLIAIISNVILLKILRIPFNRTKTNGLLTSRAFVDLLSGILVGPLFAWQLLNNKALANCNVDVIRRSIVFVIGCSSFLSLAVIAHDRCILLTKLNSYECCMTRKKFIILVAFTWIFPVFVLCVGMIGEKAYFTASLLLFFGSMTSIGFSYYSIRKAMKKHNEIMAQRQREATLHTDIKNNRNTEQKRRELIHVKLAKLVICLIFCYFFCMIFVDAWLVLHYIEHYYYIMNPETYQILYPCAFVLYQLNSCLNPLIIFVKNSTLRRQLKTLLSIK